MAFIGLRYPMAAKITAETAGSEPTYGESGSGFYVGKAMTANLTITRNDNPLYADDVIAEEDNGITGMSIELGVDDVAEDIQVKLLGTKSVAGSTTADPTIYYDTEAGADPVGFGYIRVRRLHGVTSYQAVWMYKVTFSYTAENSTTKGEAIEWQTPTLTGRAAGVPLSNPAGIAYRKRAIFTTEAAAITWLKGMANVT